LVICVTDSTTHLWVSIAQTSLYT